VFLVKIMNFGWDEAHDLTDGFALGVDQKLEDRMDTLTGHPTRCPHGEPIPSREGVLPPINDRSLTTLQTGEIGHISRVRTHDGPKLRYLAEQKLTPGVGFRVLSHAPFNGPIRILTDSNEHILGHELGQVIWVETLDGEIDPNLCNRAGCPLPKAADLYGRIPPKK
jgi:DtxR family Mn-dependent transcriptional regulator